MKNKSNDTLHVIYGSRTGNSRSAAQLAYEYSQFLGLSSEIVDMQEFEPSTLSKFRNILLAVSTHGEGDPPLAAENLLNFLVNREDNTMKGAKFSVLALGDSSYRHFCKTGHDFREQLLRLGAEEIFRLQECDIDFEEDAKRWVEGAVKAFQEKLPTSGKKQQKQFTFEIARPDEASGRGYLARILEKRILNEANLVKKVMHMTLSLKNSGIEYNPGDSVGIYSYNSRRLVDELIRRQGFDPTHVLESKNIRSMLKQSLISDFELTLLTPVVVKKYADVAEDEKLIQLIKNKARLEEYCKTRDIVDLITDFPAPLPVEDFLAVLRKLSPRLYSVASSPKKDPEKVDIMVGLVAFGNKERQYEGVSSSFLSTRIEKGESVGLYLEENPKFHLPDDHLPIIMIGAGTGLAPFRAFLQEREERGAPGHNWLFFGEQYSATDFFYQQEIERYLKKGLLTRLNTSFSRDQTKKIYIDQRMLEESKELYRWIRKGAVIYVCGNKRKLALSVRNAWRRILAEQGGLSEKEADQQLTELKAMNRYREDIY